MGKFHKETDEIKKLIASSKPKRTTMSLSITTDDKIRLLVYANKKSVSAANLIHHWIQEFTEPVE